MSLGGRPTEDERRLHRRTIQRWHVDRLDRLIVLYRQSADHIEIVRLSCIPPAIFPPCSASYPPDP